MDVRIGRDHAIDPLVARVILLPTVVGLVWFVIFGAAVTSHCAEVGTAQELPEAQMFGVLEALSLGVVGMILASVFFVSGVDAASLVTNVLLSAA